MNESSLGKIGCPATDIKQSKGCTGQKKNILNYYFAQLESLLTAQTVRIFIQKPLPFDLIEFLNPAKGAGPHENSRGRTWEAYWVVSTWSCGQHKLILPGDTGAAKSVPIAYLDAVSPWQTLHALLVGRLTAVTGQQCASWGTPSPPTRHNREGLETSQEKNTNVKSKKMRASVVHSAREDTRR